MQKRTVMVWLFAWLTLTHASTALPYWKIFFQCVTLAYEAS